MSYLNLMQNQLKPREVNEALEGGSSVSTLTHATLTLTGDGTTSYSVTFPHRPLFFAINGKALADEWCGTALTPYGCTYVPFITANRDTLGGNVSYSQDGLTMTVSTSGDAGYIANEDECTITVDYYYN